MINAYLPMVRSKLLELDKDSARSFRSRQPASSPKIRLSTAASNLWLSWPYLCRSDHLGLPERQFYSCDLDFITGLCDTAATKNGIEMLLYHSESGKRVVLVGHTNPLSIEQNSYQSRHSSSSLRFQQPFFFIYQTSKTNTAMMIVRNSLLVLAAVVTVAEAGNVKRIRNRNVIKVDNGAAQSKSHSSLMQENKKIEQDLAALFKKENRRDLQDMSMSMGGGGGDMSMDMGGGGGDMSMSMDMSPARSKPTLEGPVATMIPPQQVADGESDAGDAPTLTADEPIDAVTDGDDSSSSSTSGGSSSTSDNSDSSRSPGEEAIVESTGADDSAATSTAVGIAATAMVLVYSLLA